MATMLRTETRAPSRAGYAPDAPPARILHVECNDDGTVGGSHQALYDLVRFIDRSRFEPVVLFYQQNKFVEMIRALGIEVRTWDAERGVERDTMRSGSRLRKLGAAVTAVTRRKALIDELRIDLVHINNSPWTAYDDWLPAARLARVPIISSAMGASGETKWFRRRLYRSFDLTLPVSRYIADAMRGHGIPDARMVTVNHGVDIEGIRARVRRSRAEVRRELGIADDVLMVAMVGNVRRWKGQHVALAGLAGLTPEERRGLHVAFVGTISQTDPDDAAFAAELRATVAREGLEGCTTFTGARSDVPDVMTAADIVLHASVTPEPGGIVVLEGMALGRVVVTASRGGHTEYLTPECGVMFDTDHPEQLTAALRGFLAEPARCARMGQAAAERVTEFSMERNAANTEAAYDRVLGGGR